DRERAHPGGRDRWRWRHERPGWHRAARRIAASMPAGYHARACATACRMIEIVSATRLSEADFWTRAPLGISLRRLAWDERLVPRIAFANRTGLPALYNARIDAPEAPGIVVFMHDDAWIDDFHLGNRLLAGLH